MSSLALPERGRISARVSSSVQNRMQEAAGIMDATLNQFLTQATQEKAEQLIERERVVTLSHRDAAAILRMLDNPPKPNIALAKAQQRYQTQLAHGALHTTLSAAHALDGFDCGRLELNRWLQTIARQHQKNACRPPVF